MLDANRSFYNSQYRSARSLQGKLRRRFSFDQQYKRKVNWVILGEWLQEHQPVRRVLEVGCGFGLNLLSFPKAVTLFATDISLPAATTFQQVCLNDKRVALICVHDSTSHLPFDTKFDLIICSHVLEHVPDDLALLQEFRRLIAPNGAVLLNVPINEKVLDVKHARQYNDESLVNRVTMAGFQLAAKLTADRWSGFFSLCEAKGDHRLLLKGMRASCAMLPYQLAEKLESKWLKSFPHHQLAVLAVPGAPFPAILSRDTERQRPETPSERRV